MEPCKHDSEFGEMRSVVKGLVKEIYGNGQRGLARSIPEMSTRIDTLIMETAELKTAVSGILRFVSEEEGRGKERRESLTEKQAAWQRSGVKISAILGVCSIITALILKLL